MKELKPFVVNVHEVHIQPYFVYAEDEDQAKEAVEMGDGTMMEDSMYFSHTLDHDLWTVREPDKTEIADYGDV
jgi:hypothetical protein